MRLSSTKENCLTGTGWLGHGSCAPMPIGVVFIQWPQMSEADIRAQFRTIKQLGYTCLKGLMVCPNTSLEQLHRLALEEGLTFWWYDQAGYEEITPAMLAKLGLPTDLDIDQALAHHRVREHQAVVAGGGRAR